MGEVEGIEVAFVDNGSGMKEKELTQLFTPFFTTKATGNGLGMSIVENVVREHMGSLDVQSEKGRGTTVRIWLPLVGRTAVQESVVPKVLVVEPPPNHEEKTV
jgi:signal transduction histidine kinase